jgi:hypothetical protein
LDRKEKAGEIQKGCLVKEKREIEDFFAGYERDPDRSIKALNELARREAPLSVLSRSSQLYEIVLFDLELSGRIDSNFGLAPVDLDSASDFDVFRLDT